ncbi:HAD hydrolase-like protein [Kaistia dalseonensis]|uniref:Phosphoglycolate phosphatase n=1 Tax=Kaistia dalseonensis TaxID=410840 RepID=A0ABU0H294_9HYPH|nr:HAD hydrolase-like protein [Kaistia dalseonensis]MCX5493459.1 HAD hydrolase-like protein [Kaistia dalseonensis]MDQ0436018.1 phosphoglycolate phosphatase [Kaistia dalseonensis]
MVDLDGTLTDPYVGISSSILYALDKLGHPAVDEITLRAAIGPPLEASFAAMLGGDPVLAKQALGFYRERYAPIGAFENRVFDGIPDSLAALRAAGVRLFVASSKPRVFCEQIIERFGLAPYFDKVHGSELDGRWADKSELIAHVLEYEAIDRDQCVMIGDRRHDILGARANQIKVIAVEWGYGSPEEFGAYPPDTIVAEVSELAPAVLRHLRLEAA